ncbi:protoporphyrinogen oxidase [Aureococcus anophagefferens]|nr:protoporphyrinogen oxidase [Aureococcus anophagefferens]
MALPKLLLPLLVASSAADSLPTCIVGGGIGGATRRVAVADYIKTNADTPVIIFEKEARLGGKIRTSYAGSQTNGGSVRATSEVAAVRGGGDGVSAAGGGYVLGAGGVVPQELGACYTSPDYTRINALLEELNLGDQVDTVPPRYVHASSGSAGVSLAQYTLTFLLQLPAVAAQLPAGCYDGSVDMTTVCAPSVVGICLTKLALYGARHAEIFGDYASGGRLPRIADLSVIDGTFGEWLDREDFTELRPILDIFQESQGYGALDVIPAYYGLLWSTPQALKLTEQQLTGATGGEDLDPKILVPGFSELVERLALRSGADDLLALTDAEAAILGDLGRCNEWQTYLLRAEDPGDLMYVDTWPANYVQPGELATTRFTARFVDDSEANDGPEEFVALALNSSGVDEADVRARVVGEAEALGATGVAVVDSFRAPNYNCRFSREGDAGGVGEAVVAHILATAPSPAPTAPGGDDDDDGSKEWLYFAAGVGLVIMLALAAIVIGYGTHVQHKRQIREIQAKKAVELTAAPGTMA